MNVTNRGHKGIAVFVDALTKYVYVVPITGKDASESVRVIMSFISIFGTMKVLITDKGKEFDNETVRNLLERYGVHHIFTSAYNPQANVQAERYNQTFCMGLRKLVESDQDNWDLYVPLMVI